MIVDDDPMVSYISREYLERDCRFAVAGEFADGREALHLSAGIRWTLCSSSSVCPNIPGRADEGTCLKNDVPGGCNSGDGRTERGKASGMRSASARRIT